MTKTLGSRAPKGMGEAGELAVVGEDDFRRMIEVDALARASEFLAEETVVVADVVARLAVPGECCMVVVGGAGSTHLDAPAKGLRRCVVVDPLGLNSWRLPTRCAWSVRPRSLHEVTVSELPAPPRLWVFTFNVFPYLREPIEALRRLVSLQDTIVVTTWAGTARAERIRRGYLLHVFGADRRPRIEARTDVGRIAQDLVVDHPGVRADYVHGQVVTAAVVRLEAG